MQKLLITKLMSCVPLILHGKSKVWGYALSQPPLFFYCECSDISAAVVGIAEIQLYGIIFTAAAVSDAYRNLLCSAAEINGAEADGRSSVKAAERASVYRGNGNIREIAKAGGNKDIRILFCFSKPFCRIFKLGDNLRNVGTVL